MNRRQPVKRYRTGTTTLLPCAALLLAGACSNAGNQGQAEKQKPQPKVKTALVQARALTERLELTGAIEPTRIARMASPVDGPIIACPVREGDRVRPGQLLARLGRTKGDDAAAASARAELDREELELGRIEKLVETGALPGEELDNARVKVSAAQARLARAMEKLGDYRLSAPWAGVVSRVNVAVGDFVAARATMVELFDPDTLVLRCAVPEDAAVRVKSGAPIAVTLDAHPGEAFSAKVTRIYPDIDRGTRTRTVEATIEEDVVLAPGMFARLQLTLASIPEALTVPAEAVVRRDGEPVVFVIENGKAIARMVETGIESANRVEIVSGIQAGDKVIVAGNEKLKNGAEVRLAGEGKSGKRQKKIKPEPTAGQPVRTGGGK
jgi:RND family efflux transporter MFP subunit